MTDHATKIVYEFIKQQQDLNDKKVSKNELLKNMTHISYVKDIDKMEKGEYEKDGK